MIYDLTFSQVHLQIKENWIWENFTHCYAPTLSTDRPKICVVFTSWISIGVPDFIKFASHVVCWCFRVTTWKQVGQWWNFKVSYDASRSHASNFGLKAYPILPGLGAHHAPPTRGHQLKFRPTVPPLLVFHRNQWRWLYVISSINLLSWQRRTPASKN